ncbi:hypothetical protein H5410_035611 [Solanum commersonii]|uniref:Uncharacterized protein n=1 Tax=Solanum commersonii TaxID=4109 RepID=A0A9J5Y165_SOLCO|nr:hypothetical protein H5410_035611 [Solanum commersonii]
MDLQMGGSHVKLQVEGDRQVFSEGNSYRDILHHNKKPFYLKGLEEDSSTMDAYVMHSVRASH